MPEIDLDLFKDIEEEAKQRLADYAQRDSEADEIYKMSIGEWDRYEDIRVEGQHIMPITSPDPANFVDGMVRLLTPSAPAIRVPKDQDNPSAVQNADDLEKAANAILDNASRVRGDPVQFDIMRNAVVFSEVHIGMSSTLDIVRDYEKRLKAEKDKAARKYLEVEKKLAEQVVDSTPYLIEVFDPRTGYPEWDNLGLRSYLRKYQVTVKELLDSFPDAKSQLKKLGSLYTMVDVLEWKDRVWHQVWLEGSDRPFFQEEHGLPFINVVAEIIQGSKQGGTPAEQRKPSLRNYWKSGMWHADNLFFTITFSNIFAMLTMPPFMSKATLPDITDDPVMDFKAKPPRVEVPYGKDLTQMQMKVITPDIMALHDLAQTKGIESTMYRQPMGEPIPGQSTYSTVAFLAQSAKTSLNMIVEKTQWVIADVAKMGLKWMRADKGTYSMRYGQGKVSLSSTDIPEDDFLVECKLSLSTPQELLGGSQIIGQLAGIQGLPLSMEWMVENLLGVDNVKEQRDKKWTEQVSQVEYQQYIQQMMAAEQQQALQNSMSQQQAGQMGAQAQDQLMAEQQMGAVPPIPEQMANPTGVPEPVPGQAMPGGMPTGPMMPPRMIPPGRSA